MIVNRKCLKINSSPLIRGSEVGVTKITHFWLRRRSPTSPNVCVSVRPSVSNVEILRNAHRQNQYKTVQDGKRQ